MDKFYDIVICDNDDDDSTRVYSAYTTYEDALKKFNDLIGDDYSFVEIREISTNEKNDVSIKIVKTWWFDAIE